MATDFWILRRIKWDVWNVLRVLRVPVKIKAESLHKDFAALVSRSEEEKQQIPSVGYPITPEVTDVPRAAAGKTPFLDQYTGNLREEALKQIFVLKLAKI